MKRSRFKQNHNLIMVGAFCSLCIVLTASAQDLEKAKPEVLGVRVEQGNLREIVIEEVTPVFRQKENTGQGQGVVK